MSSEKIIINKKEKKKITTKQENKPVKGNSRARSHFKYSNERNYTSGCIFVCMCDVLVAELKYFQC